MMTLLELSEKQKRDCSLVPRKNGKSAVVAELQYREYLAACYRGICACAKLRLTLQEQRNDRS